MPDLVYGVSLERRFWQISFLWNLSISANFLDVFTNGSNRSWSVQLNVAHRDLDERFNSADACCLLFLRGDQVTISMVWFRVQVNLNFKPL